MSSEEVPQGKPSPDVYLEAARRLGVEPARCAAIEDSANGARSALAAGMTTLLIPNRRYPPPADVRDAAAAVLDQLADLTVAMVHRANLRHLAHGERLVTPVFAEGSNSPFRTPARKGFPLLAGTGSG